MDSTLVWVIVLALSIALQFLAAGLALRLIPLSQGRVAWLLISLAAVLMGVRRCFSLWRLIQGPAEPAIDPWAEAVAWTISLAMAGGMYRIGPLFIERRRAEAQREELRAQLAEVQRIECVGRLAGGVAHDLNNFLSPIIAYADVLLEEAPAGSRMLTDLGEIKRAAERARELTRQLLALGRKQVLDFRTIDLRQELGCFEKLLRLAVREDIRLELRIPATLGLVRADSGQIEQVLMNLAVNARQAMPAGGVLTLELADAEVDEAQARLEPGLRPGPWVRLSVSDTGTGMEPAVLDRIFEPFFTTKKPGEGTGLGLSIVHGIVAQHGGRVVVESTPGRGSTFHVLLPRAAGEAASETVSAAPPPPVRRATETILLAEDEDLVRHAAVRVLERLGYRVLASGDAATCLDQAAREPGRIDLLLTDVVMPGLNGRQLRERLGETHPGIKAVYMSGHADEVVALHGVIERGAGFVQKPFTAEALGAAVRRALGT